MSLPAKLRYTIGARLMASHGNTIEEICHAIQPEACYNVVCMLNIFSDQLLTYALGPDWQEYKHLTKRKYHTCCQIRLVTLYRCCHPAVKVIYNLLLCLHRLPCRESTAVLHARGAHMSCYTWQLHIGQFCSA